jgi:hypothetical protein
VGLPGFKPGVGSEMVPGGFDSHTPPPISWRIALLAEWFPKVYDCTIGTSIAFEATHPMSSRRRNTRHLAEGEAMPDHAAHTAARSLRLDGDALVAAPQWVHQSTSTRYVSAADAALVSACVAGDQAAWETFIQRHQGRVFNVTFHMTHDAERAADLAQEALLQVLRSLPRFRGEASLTTWIHGLTMRVCLHHLRRERRAGELRRAAAGVGKPPAGPAPRPPGRGAVVAALPLSHRAARVGGHDL